MTVTEKCCCGAEIRVVDEHGLYGPGQIREFREAHAGCRVRAVAPQPHPVIPDPVPVYPKPPFYPRSDTGTPLPDRGHTTCVTTDSDRRMLTWNVA